MTDKDGGPAFARPFSEVDDNGEIACEHYAQTGMSLRDYFAAAALIGHLADPTEPKYEEHAETAANAFRIADAMLAERGG